MCKTVQYPSWEYGDFLAIAEVFCLFKADFLRSSNALRESISLELDIKVMAEASPHFNPFISRFLIKHAAIQAECVMLFQFSQPYTLGCLTDLHRAVIVGLTPQDSYTPLSGCMDQHARAPSEPLS